MTARLVGLLERATVDVEARGPPEAQVVRLEDVTALAQVMEHLADSVRAGARRARDDHLPDEAHPLRRVRSAERNVEQRRVLRRADLLLAQIEMSDAVRVLLLGAGESLLERRPLQPFVLLAVEERGLLLLDAESAHVDGPGANRQIARRVDPERVSLPGALRARVTRNTEGPDDVEELLASLLGRDFAGFIEVGLQNDPALLGDDAAVLLRSIVGTSCSVAGHERLP